RHGRTPGKTSAEYSSPPIPSKLNPARFPAALTAPDVLGVRLVVLPVAGQAYCIDPKPRTPVPDQASDEQSKPDPPDRRLDPERKQETRAQAQPGNHPWIQPLVRGQPNGGEIGQRVINQNRKRAERPCCPDIAQQRQRRYQETGEQHRGMRGRRSAAEAAE